MRHPFANAASLVLGVVALACGGGGRGGGTPTSPPPPTPPTATASFQISSSAGSQSLAWAEGPNRVFCTRNAGWADLWIRLAAQRVANGENGPHVDIDLCRLEGGGVFAPKDPRTTQCGGAKTWDVWWHDGAGNVYTNTALAAQCTFTVTVDGSQLAGGFACRDLVEADGVRRVDVLDGTFRCTLE